MKIQEILNEDVSPEEKRELLTEYAGIKMFAEEQCQPYLKEIGGFENALFRTPMYRGMMSLTFPKGQYSSVVNIRQDRQPTDTPPMLQSLIDDWFQHHFSIRFRQTSLHCTGLMSTARAYSSTMVGPVIVLPMGDYHYAYSEVYNDLYQSLHDFGIKLPNSGKGMSRDDTLSFYENRIIEFMDAGHYQVDHGLTHAIQSGAEIMISGRKALIVQQKFLKALVTRE